MVSRRTKLAVFEAGYLPDEIQFYVVLPCNRNCQTLQTVGNYHISYEFLLTIITNLIFLFTLR